ncbi:tetrahydromethanopterin S-methyltransferase subunit B [uncultured Methanobrevibacter sp.]|uniref:tetrahydromethanopterin S-methyltransferase subunit B n=1 Tax=uncultured Methanobrevibacter sp. TaxID=253161 RepID=UPI0025FCB10E|nr:tetrahydromethanopterin S-methyltransferase subunit B [uncultured Methanobrevibacter sp.]
MADMLPFINIIPEMNLNLDPVSGILGAGGSDLVILSMDEINAEIDKIDAAAEELVNSLDPSSSPIGAAPNREGTYISAGLLTNFVYGFLIAALIIFAIIPLLMKVGVL